MGHMDIVGKLISSGADINKSTKDGVTSLMMACKNGNIEVVKHLISNGADINKPNKIGVTALFVACQYGHGKAVEYLLSHGADKEKATNYDVRDISKSHTHHMMIELIFYLLQICKSSFWKHTWIFASQGKTPLIVACQYGHCKVVDLLLSSGADRHKATDVVRDKSKASYIMIELIFYFL